MGQRCAKASLARWGTLATVGLIAVSLAGAAQSFGQALRPDAVFTISGRVLLLAADDNSAAVTTEVKRACARRIVVWTAPERRSTSVKPGILGCSGDGISRLAVGGGRVAWIEQGGGNNLEMSLMTASLGGRTMKQLEFVTNGDRAGADPAGDWMGQLFGAGSLLAYNSWTQVCDKPADQQCGEKDPQLRLTNQKLLRIASGRRVVVTRGTDAYPLTAVGGGRLAVEAAGAVTIRAASGAKVATVPAVAGSARAVTLSKTRLAIERTLMLDLYNPGTGAAEKSLRLGAAASLQLADVTSKLALLRGPHRLVLVRLSDGRRLSFPLRPRAAATLAGGRLTRAGLFYAYNTRSTLRPGRIVFEPMGKLLSRF